MATREIDSHTGSLEDGLTMSTTQVGGQSTESSEMGPEKESRAEERTSNKRLHSTSPNSQMDQKKLNRGDSTNSQASETSDSMVTDETFSNASLGDTNGASKSVRVKAFSDILSKSMAANSNPSPVLDTDPDDLEVDSSADSLYVQLRNLAGYFKESTDTSVNADSQYMNISLTPMIKNLFKADAKFTDEPSDKSVLTENNLYLKTITKILGGMNDSLKKNADSLTQQALKIDYVKKYVDKSVDDLKLKMQASEEERGELRTIIGKSYDYVDEKINALKRAIPVTMDELGVDIERKQEEMNDELRIALGKTIEKADSRIGSVSRRVDNLEKTLHEKISLTEKNTRIELDAIRENLKKFSPEGNNVKVQALQTELHRCQEKLATYEGELSKTNKKLDEALAKINNLDPNTGFTEQCSNIRKLEQKQQRALEEFSDRMDGLEYSLRVNMQSTKLSDIQRRKNNILIDQLTEVPNENLIDRLSQIFNVTLNQFDRGLVVIKAAYRLGKFRADQRNPRKIMLQLDGPIGRETLIKNARQITKSGNDGRPYYLNEDLSEADKRKKNDLYKYKKYLEERKHIVERENDFFIIDGQKWHIEQLNQLPIGMRLLDSRTRFHQGTVAFQSWVSPLSNLFLCKLRYNGKSYRSLEHAYQFLKATHHGSTDTATDIKHEPDPYVVMSYGNSITENKEWMAKKLDIMEQLVRCKEDQVAIFRDTLQRTFSYKLVENTWSSFWGSSCPYLSDIVWSGQYRGLNHLGRILEKVRDNS